MPNVLGIDLGGLHVGLAVVQRPENRVLWCGTLHLSDKIKKLYELRRILLGQGFLQEGASRM